VESTVTRDRPRESTHLPTAPGDNAGSPVSHDDGGNAPPEVRHTHDVAATDSRTLRTGPTLGLLRQLERERRYLHMRVLQSESIHVGRRTSQKKGIIVGFFEISRFLNQGGKYLRPPLTERPAWPDGSPRTYCRFMPDD